MTILVTGGTGYIGAHVVDLLRGRGDEVVIVDDMETGNAMRVPGVPIHKYDIAAEGAYDGLLGVMKEHHVRAVIHFAGRKQVGESVQRPAWYHHQNVGGMANLLMAMETAKVTTMVFSSSAAVYGNTKPGAIEETDATVPINPYGETKLVGEWMMASSSKSFGLNGASLRYFNVAGAARDELGDVMALNLIPMVFQRIEGGEPPAIFGDDYATKDGTCVRDFIHVSDLADAHIATLDHLEYRNAPGHHVFNVGTGKGYSVAEVIDSISRITEKHLRPVVLARRVGDPASVVANSQRLQSATGWNPKYGLDDMTRSAWHSWTNR